MGEVVLDGDAVLIPIRPAGNTRLARAAREYMKAWDARYIHPMTCYAPGARVATREALPGPRAAQAAPFLWGRRVSASPSAHVESPIAESLDAWVTWARDEGEAWGELSRRDPRFARFSPVSSWPSWWRHNAFQVTRRVGEVAQSMRRLSPLAAYLHVIREAAWCGGFVRATRR